MAPHSPQVTLALPLWKGPCAHEKIKVLGSCVPRAQSEVIEVGVGVNSKRFILHEINMWIRSADFGAESFCFLHQEKTKLHFVLGLYMPDPA